MITIMMTMTVMMTTMIILIIIIIIIITFTPNNSKSFTYFELIGVYRCVAISCANVGQSVDNAERRLPRALCDVRRFGIEDVAQLASNVSERRSIVYADSLTQR